MAFRQSLILPFRLLSLSGSPICSGFFVCPREKAPPTLARDRCFLVGVKGFEPRHPAPKAGALPTALHPVLFLKLLWQKRIHVKVSHQTAFLLYAILVKMSRDGDKSQDFIDFFPWLDYYYKVSKNLV